MLMNSNNSKQSLNKLYTTGLMVLFSSYLLAQPAVESVNGTPGSTVSTHVYIIESFFDITDFQFDIQYNNTLLTADVANCGLLVETAEISCHDMGTYLQVRIDNPDEIVIPTTVIGYINFSIDINTPAPSSFSLPLSNDYYAGYFNGVPFLQSPSNGFDGQIDVYEHLSPGAVIGTNSVLPGGNVTIPIAYLGTGSTVTKAEWDIYIGGTDIVGVNLINCGGQIGEVIFSCSNTGTYIHIKSENPPQILEEIPDILLGEMIFTINPGADAPSNHLLAVSNELYIFDSGTIGPPPIVIPPLGTVDGLIEILSELIFTNSFE